MTITATTTIHYVADMSRALSFYKSLGLTATSESDGWSTLALAAGSELALHPREAREAGDHPFHAFRTTLSLSVDDLAPYTERLVAAGGEVLEVMEPRPGIPVRMALVRDTEGNGFQINQFVPPA